MKKQTAVQWLESEMLKPNLSIKDILIQAKEIEKQQIKDANIVGVNCGLYGYRSAEQYFNKTYKK
jgi:hypothetical protein